MQAIEGEVINYIQLMLSERPALREVTLQLASKLPLFLRSKYELHETRILGRDCILAFEKQGEAVKSPTQYSANANAIKAKLGKEVILVLPSLPSFLRNRLAHQRVSFIVPGTQMFLPFLLLDFREVFHPLKKSSRKQLTPTAQVVVLRHLNREPLNDLPLKEIAGLLGYSAMTITNVSDELEAAKICRAVRRGRMMTLHFEASRDALWRQVEPLLSSPVKRAHWLNWREPGYPALTAGMTALSRLTMIEDDRHPTFALPQATFLKNLEKGLFNVCEDPDDANIRMETWSYNPHIVTTSNEMVDPLSLFLSLRDSRDERVQQQLSDLIEQKVW